MEMKSNQGWSLQLWTQFMQLRKNPEKKFRTSTEFEPVTSPYKYLQVLGSNPAEVLKLFFSGFLCNYCINCT